MKGQRKEYIDVLRGFAVGCMLVWHTASSWVVPSLQTGSAWAALRAIGGMGAPLFLLLAGVSVTLKGDRRITAGFDWALLRRGLQIVLLGYLLRLQMWMVDSGAVVHPNAWQCYLPLLFGFGLGWMALRRAPVDRRSWWLAVLAAFCLLAGYARVAALFPARLDGLWRVDVLQIIGVSLVIITLLISKVRNPTSWLILAIAVTLVAHELGKLLPGVLPVPIAAYLARWPIPAGARQMAMFPLFPWLAYLLVGLVAGKWFAREERGWRILGVAAVGWIAAALITESRSYIHDLIVEAPVFTHLIRVAYRVCVGAGLAGVAYAACRWLTPVTVPWRLYGQTSLLIYWVHLEFAFGKAAHLFRPCETLLEWAWKFAALSAAMLAVSYARLNLRFGSLYSSRTNR